MEQENICSAIRELENQYAFGAPVILGKYVSFDMFETIERIQAYLNSVHTSGLTDSLGREKPFFNIVTAAVNVWYRATDLDRKNIKIKASKRSDTVEAFLANIIVQEWMKKNNFGVFLNDWGRTLAQYGSAVSKFVEKDGELHAEVIPWSRLICDQVDFANNLKIEKLYFTPSQLRKKEGYDKEMVNELIESAKSTRKTLGRETVDVKADYIEVYEAHGEMPLSWITGDEKDQDTYVQQMQVVSFQSKGKGEYDDFILARGREKKDPYVISHLIKEEGRTLAIGAVEYLFDSQWMVNHSIKLVKDQLDLASKLIFQTSDPAFINYNALEAIETGDILVNNGNPITQIQNNSHDVTSLQNFKTEWMNNAKEITSSTDAARGNTQPSGTAYRLQALVTQQSLSLFELMTENKGLALENMLREHIIPFIKKHIDTTDEISARLDDHQIRKIDKMYLPNEVARRSNKRIKELVLSGKIVSPYQQQQIMDAETEALKSDLKSMGDQRFIKPSEIETETWKDALSNLEWDLEIEITDEQKDKSATLDTLNSLFERVIQKQGQPFTPREAFLFNSIVAETGIVSPIELDFEEPQMELPETVEQQTIEQPALATGGA